MEKHDKCFRLLNNLRHNPPFWFHHALDYCRFERAQLEELLESNVESSGDDPYEVLGTHSLLNTQRAIECGLIEPIFRSIAEYNGNRFDDLMKLLQETANNIGSTFPWMFLAYLGAMYQNLRLVERCLLFINEEKKAGKIQEFEVGMSYQVWRFLIKGGATSNGASVTTGGHLDKEWESTFLELPWAKHDWTFVHLASAYGDAECLDILLNRPCNQKREVLNAATEVEGFTPLHLAVYYGHAAIVKLLLEHADKFFPAAASGAAPDGQQSTLQAEESVSQHIPRDRIFKRSPLHFAAAGFLNPEVLSILIDKWGSVGVDLPDRFGITALHLAAARPGSSKKKMLRMLLAVSRKPYQRVVKDFALQKAALLGLFRDFRCYINKSAKSSTLFIPRPDGFIRDQFFWFNVGFTFLHVMGTYGEPADFQEVLKHDSLAEVSFWDAPDCQGLSAVVYAATLKRFNSFFKDSRVQNAGLSETFKYRSISRNRSKAFSQLLMGSQVQGEVIRKLFCVFRLGSALVSGDYAIAVLESAWEQSQEIRCQLSSILGSWKWMLDDEVWDHLQWALDKALQPDLSAGGVLLQRGPSLHHSQAEQIVLHLAVRRDLLRGKSPKQRCLQWAIEKRMASLAEELVKDTECELVSVVPGSKHEQSPLAQASNTEVAREMPGLLTAMELREDVKRRWFEDRQVYVDYANTLLVGAVLIAGLAFAGWLQPPRGYADMGVIDMKRHTMRVFVYSSSLAFFLGMGTVVAGATGAMPFAIGAGQLIRARDRVHKSIVTASILLVASIICLSTSFAAALLAVLPFHVHHSVSISAFLVVNGVMLCAMLVSFLRRLEGLSRLSCLAEVKLWVRSKVQQLGKAAATAANKRFSKSCS